ncbi:hypothetical protein HYW83_06790 [Candidatus Peregrinibacteria bacterium]|nr:hypothetical protein [Candidatus Peregrinibacteria bacterium]
MQGINTPKEPLTLESLPAALDSAIHDSAKCKQWAEEFVPVWRAFIRQAAPLYRGATPSEKAAIYELLHGVSRRYERLERTAFERLGEINILGLMGCLLREELPEAGFRTSLVQKERVPGLVQETAAAIRRDSASEGVELDSDVFVEDYRAREFLIVEDDLRVRIPELLRQKRGSRENDEGVKWATNASDAERAIDDFVQKASGGEKLFIICDMEFPRKEDGIPIPTCGRQVMEYAKSKIAEWNQQHPDHPPCELEIFMNTTGIKSQEQCKLGDGVVGFNPAARDKDSVVAAIDAYFRSNKPS